MYIPIAPLPPTDPFSVAVDVIANIVQFLGGSTKGLKQLAHDTGVLIQHTLNILGGNIRTLLNLIRHHIADLFRRAVQLIRNLREKLKRILEPVIKHAKQIRDLWDHTFNRFIAPILNSIQHMRQTLTIFRVFHLKFAEKLDAKLANLEGEIARRFLKVKQEINGTLNYLELILHPELYVREVAAIRSLTKAFEAVRASVKGVKELANPDALLEAGFLSNSVTGKPLEFWTSYTPAVHKPGFPLTIPAMAEVRQMTQDFMKGTL